ncbi:diphthine methyltransferase [Coccinella septempunctata]|uniref:diphthine methyltransferase n=1 Tax=Coccinella septempunctata TaxID=41139 RepID=UPI001D09283F|nr:diphthine methyltransferase [Coccinella septempunctata]
MTTYKKLSDGSDDDLPRNVSIKTVYTWKTEFNADSVEWCPCENFRHVFVCGNYQLLPKPEGSDYKKRIGRILLFSINEDTGLKLEQEYETAAVLDQKWCHHEINGSILLGVVNSNAKLKIFKLEKDKDALRLKKIDSFKFSSSDDELLILSLDWSTNKLVSNEPEIICSDSKGSVHILKLVQNQLVLKTSVVKFHEFETWIAGFYYWDPHIYFSGGDDCIFYKYDQRVGTDAVAKNRSHEAGVTSLHSNISKEYVIATGSYDENVRIWDLRNLKCPKTETKIPGPVWRVKWDPFSQSHLLVAGMLGGAHVISEVSHSIVDSYYEHENLVYGVDWCFMKEESVQKYPKEGNAMLASCSFYDNLLCISKLKCEI